MSKVTKQVLVGGVETKSGESGEPPRKWRRWGLKDADDKFVGSTFSGTIGKFLQDHEGQRIEVDIEEKEGERGTLRDLLDAREVGSGTQAPATASDAPTVAALNRIANALEKLAEREKAFDPDAIPF